MIQVIFGDSSRFCSSWTFVHFYALRLSDKGTYCVKFVYVCLPVSPLVCWLISWLVSQSVCLNVYQLIPMSANFNLNFESIQSTAFIISYTCTCSLVQALTGDCDTDTQVTLLWPTTLMIFILILWSWMIFHGSCTFIHPSTMTTVWPWPWLWSQMTMWGMVFCKHILLFFH